LNAEDDPDLHTGAEQGQENIDRVLNSSLPNLPGREEKRQRLAARRSRTKRRKIKTAIILIILIVASTTTIQTVWAW